jgi:4-diphosphocytidyl-2-C-methyl-D-erythritol kinase
VSLGVVVRAPAKINLVLRVGARRDDGYHDVVSLMARVDVGDTLALAPSSTTVVRCPSIVGGDTLVTRALAELALASGAGGGFRVAITKALPVGAGLGGGSSDAAAALRAANGMLARPVPESTLVAIAARIGSDVPFFLGPAAAIARGRGEATTPVEGLPPCAVALAYPGRPLATRDVYEAYRPAGPLEEEITIPDTLDGLAALVENDLGPVAERLEPACGQLRRALEQRGAAVTAVSGSGSAVFGLFATLESATEAVRGLPGAAWSQAATLLVS